MASIQSVRAPRLRISARLLRELRFLSMAAVLGVIAAVVPLRLGWLVPRLKALVGGVDQADIFLGVMVLTAAAIVVAVRAAAAYRDNHEEHDVR